MCDCLEKADKVLAEKNTKIEYAWMFNSGEEFPQIVTTKIDRKKRGRPYILVCTYCPMCGEKLPRKAEIDAR